MSLPKTATTRFSSGTAIPFPISWNCPNYPEARDLSDADLARNIEQLKWFTAEADRRGIWTVLHFYNIHVSPNFAKAHEQRGRTRLENAVAAPRRCWKLTRATASANSSSRIPTSGSC